MRLALASVIAAVGLIAFAATSGRSDDEAVNAKREAEPAVAQPNVDKLPPATSASLRRLLSEKVTIPDQMRAAPVPFKIVLQYLSNKAAARGEWMPVVIDKQAFKDAAPDANDLLDVPIELPTFVPSMTYRQALEHSMSQLPGDGVFLVRDDQIVILSGAAAKVERLLDRRINADFRNKPLMAALEELADRSGVGIAVDPRCDDTGKKTVTLLSEQGMTLRGVLESIADMNDLKIVVTPHRVTVLPQAIYMKRLADRAQESKLRREIEGDPTMPEGPRLEAPKRNDGA
jgi:hypothetical protein